MFLANRAVFWLSLASNEMRQDIRWKVWRHTESDRVVSAKVSKISLKQFESVWSIVGSRSFQTLRCLDKLASLDLACVANKHVFWLLNGRDASPLWTRGFGENVNNATHLALGNETRKSAKWSAYIFRFLHVFFSFLESALRVCKGCL